MRECLASRTGRLILAGCVAAVAACSDEPVRVYHVASAESAAESAAQVAHAAGPHGGAKTHSIRWSKPEGWTENPPDETRVGNYAAPGGDGTDALVTVISLAGSAGGTLANVNRWRDQIELPPVGAGDLAPTTLATGDGRGTIEVFDLDGGDEMAMIAAQLPLQAETWFFKMTGTRAAVAAQKDAYLAMLAAVEVAPPTAGDPGAHALPDVGAPVLAVPDGWEKTAGSSMRLASFRVAGADGREADVSVISLMGDGGGLEANLNLWRSQVQLPDLDIGELQAQSTPVESGLGAFTLVHFESEADLLGDGRPAAILGAVGPAGERTWFFKMTGDAGLIAERKAEFQRFVESATPPATPP